MSADVAEYLCLYHKWGKQTISVKAATCMARQGCFKMSKPCKPFKAYLSVMMRSQVSAEGTWPLLCSMASLSSTFTAMRCATRDWISVAPFSPGFAALNLIEGNSCEATHFLYMRTGMILPSGWSFLSRAWPQYATTPVSYIRYI